MVKQHLFIEAYKTIMIKLLNFVKEDMRDTVVEKKCALGMHLNKGNLIIKRRFFQKWDFLLRVASPPPRGFCWISAKNEFSDQTLSFPHAFAPDSLCFLKNFQNFVV